MTRLTKPPERSVSHFRRPSFIISPNFPPIVDIHSAVFFLPASFDFSFVVIVPYEAKFPMQDRILHLNLIPTSIRFDCRLCRQDEVDMCREHRDCKYREKAGTDRQPPGSIRLTYLDSPDCKPNHLTINSVHPRHGDRHECHDIYAEKGCPKVENDEELLG